MGQGLSSKKRTKHSPLGRRNTKVTENLEKTPWSRGPVEACPELKIAVKECRPTGQGPCEALLRREVFQQL